MLPLHYGKIFAVYSMRHFDVYCFSSVLVTFRTFYLSLAFNYSLTIRACVGVSSVRARFFVYMYPNNEKQNPHSSLPAESHAGTPPIFDMNVGKAEHLQAFPTFMSKIAYSVKR